MNGEALKTHIQRVAGKKLPVNNFLEEEEFVLWRGAHCEP